MAKAVILTKQKQLTKRIESANFPVSTFSEGAKAAKINKTVVYGKVVKIDSSDFPVSVISEGHRTVKIEQALPFRIRFTNITVPGYSYPNNVPPIGIAIIGLNNYIL
jgi:hypothetical protein